MNIYFVRHGETDYNSRNIIQGCGIDSDLNEKGIKQSLELYTSLNSISFDKLIASNLVRSQQTLSPFKTDGLDISIDDRIREICWGKYEGLKANTLLQKVYKEMIHQWAIGNLDFKIEGGESCNELLLRINDFLEELTKLKLKNILVCTHGRTLRALLSIVNNENPSQMEKYKPDNCSMFLVTYKNDTFTLVNKDI